tara:strand:+ start:5039 stop:5365 length:327 start_codon:yes stop_codon:yes gene_type:complete
MPESQRMEDILPFIRSKQPFTVNIQAQSPPSRNADYVYGFHSQQPYMFDKEEHGIVFMKTLKDGAWHPCHWKLDTTTLNIYAHIQHEYGEIWDCYEPSDYTIQKSKVF